MLSAYDRPYYNREAMLRAFKALASAQLMTYDFETALDQAEPGDWVYLDPPYVPLGGWAGLQAVHAGPIWRGRP